MLVHRRLQLRRIRIICCILLLLLRHLLPVQFSRPHCRITWYSMMLLLLRLLFFLLLLLLLLLPSPPLHLLSLLLFLFTSFVAATADLFVLRSRTVEEPLNPSG